MKYATPESGDELAQIASVPLIRRKFLARLVALALFAAVLGLLAACGGPVSSAPQKPKVPRIGYLARSAHEIKHATDMFQQGLSRLGYVQGQNIQVEFRYGDTPEELNKQVADLVSLPVDVIVSSDAEAIDAARRATSTIPIVMCASEGDPVAQGFIASFARPAGNVTGISLATPELGGKQLELLKEAFPGLSRVAYLYNPASMGSQTDQEQESVQQAAQALGLRLDLVKVQDAGALDGALETIKTNGDDGLVAARDTLFYVLLDRIDEFVGKARMPAMFSTLDIANHGGLMAYGVNDEDLHLRVAVYVDKILKGAKPADLPVEGPSQYELTVNLKTAQTLGLTIPQSILAQADQIVQ